MARPLSMLKVRGMDVCMGDDPEDKSFYLCRKRFRKAHIRRCGRDEDTNEPHMIATFHRVCRKILLAESIERLGESFSHKRILYL